MRYSKKKLMVLDAIRKAQYLQSQRKLGKYEGVRLRHTQAKGPYGQRKNWFL